jgi:hypothetical protein
VLKELSESLPQRELRINFVFISQDVTLAFLSFSFNEKLIVA